MSKEIAENHFEQVYKEYKEYQTFYNSVYKSPQERNKELSEYVLKNKDKIDDIANKMFETNIGYHMYEMDFLNLRKKLLHTYNAYIGIVDFPAEIKKEMAEIKLEPQNYIIKNGTAEELNPEYNKTIKENLKKSQEPIVKQILEQKLEKDE